ncbi:hypothetical protein [Methylobacterium sp. 77]|uniref:hypothetical protein n=1 Tax=Methylobacterium sp. 77 TaxID=1101192 RepID=UPI0003818F88|nr:hypothetical protein [Methylobacterium sp. 77]
MRLVLTAASLCVILAGSAASAQSGGSLFGSPNRVPANPFASNYPSAPPPRAEARDERVPGGTVRRRAMRPRQNEALRPPRDIPR